MAPDLIGQAATGSVVAQMKLVDLAIEAGTSGIVREIEALMSAEIWARLAASIGGEAEVRTLAGVLFARSSFEHQRDGSYNADYYEHQARAVLGSLDPNSDTDSRSRGQLELVAAANGDISTLAKLCDEALSLLHSGRADPIEALTAAEAYARMAAASSQVDQTIRLADTLMERARYEYRDGWRELGETAEAEAVLLISALADEGVESMQHALVLLTTGPIRPAISLAARCQANLLHHLHSEGTC